MTADDVERSSDEGPGPSSGAHRERGAAATLQAIVDDAPLAIIVVDRACLVTAWNPAAERLFGWSAVETMGRLLPIIREGDWDDFVHKVAEAFAGTVQGISDERRRRKDGSEIRVSGSRALMRDAAGEPIGLVGMLTDVSEQARAAAAHSESEERYRSVVNGLEEGITLHDAEGRILTANPSAARILGVSAARLAGRSLFDPSWGPVDDELRPFPAERHPLAITLREGRPCSGVVLRIQAPDGERRWLQVSSGPIASGGAARAVCAFVDVTVSRHEEERSRRSESNFRTLIELSPDAIAVYQGAAVLYANARMLALLGYESKEELVGRGPLDFVHPEDRAMVGERIRTYALRGLETPPAEERFLRKDGSAVSVEVISIPIFFDDARCTLVHARDLTERKQIEAQLVMADRLASVGRLAATVGHEINNPLAYVLANLELALERLGAPTLPPLTAPPSAPVAEAARARNAEIAEMLREAREGAERVRSIVRDLKVFSRGESEERARVDPRRVLDSCVNMATGEIRHRARLVKRYQETPRVLANEARLGQVLLNLLINAAHAIPEDASDLQEITVSTSTDARGRVVLEVRDTGVGMTDEVKKHIFEPFFTTKTGGLGTGLGLSICQSIVTTLGGEIAVESEPGRGTSFRVFLPPAPEGEGPPSGLL